MENLPDGYPGPLRDALADPDREVRLQAADSVRELVEVLPGPATLAVHLDSSDPVVRAAVVYVLSARRAGAAEDYRRALTDTDQRVRIEAVRALVSVDDVDGVAAASADESREVRIAVANALATLRGGADTVRGTARRPGSAGAGRRPGRAGRSRGGRGRPHRHRAGAGGAGLAGAGRRGQGAVRGVGTAAVAALSRALVDAHLDVRKAAVLSLTRWADSEAAARDALGLALKDADADVRAYARRALEPA